MHKMKCPSCQQLLKYRDEFAGKTIRCPKCKNPIRLLSVHSNQVQKKVTVPPQRPSPPSSEDEFLDDYDTTKGFDQEEGNNQEWQDSVVDEEEQEDEELVRPKPRKPKKKKKKSPLPMILVFFLFLVLVGGGGVAGYFWWLSQQTPSPATTSYKYDPSDYNYENADDVVFKDNPVPNFDKEPASVLSLEFVDQDGNPFALKDFEGQKHIVLVFMRGLTEDPGGVCPHCTVQTSRLIRNYEKFQEKDAEILLVYPGKTEDVKDFVEAVKKKSTKEVVPFPVLLDVEFTAVDQLGIREDQAKPSTYIINNDGELRFGYVGRNTVDRPSLQFLLNQLDQLNQ